ncbi:MAG: hypothetical protein ACT4O3_07035 [Elusimicrobiota bacterium]
MTPDSPAHKFYRHAFALLQEGAVPFLVGGAYALRYYTGIVRDTRDLDIFLRADDCTRALDLFSAAGYRTELTFPHWLGKVTQGPNYIDLIYASGNGLCAVDEEWFRRAVPGEALGAPVLLAPPEEMIWQKSFVMERERYDGADVLHMLRACGPRLNWEHLLRRFGVHWRVLLSHLVLFGYVYPADRGEIPAAVLGGLLDLLRADADGAAPADLLCRGTFLSRAQYRVDVERWGYRDARLSPGGPMSREDVDRWTDAAEREEEAARGQ